MANQTVSETHIENDALWTLSDLEHTKPLRMDEEDKKRELLVKQLFLKEHEMRQKRRNCLAFWYLKQWRLEKSERSCKK